MTLCKFENNLSHALKRSLLEKFGCPFGLHGSLFGIFWTPVIGRMAVAPYVQVGGCVERGVGGRMGGLTTDTTDDDDLLLSNYHYY